jgi:hypothetical protein
MILMKNGTIFLDKDPKHHSHARILDQNNIIDHKDWFADDARRSFCKIEVKNANLSLDIDVNWRFLPDHFERIQLLVGNGWEVACDETPVWFQVKHVKACLRAAKDWQKVAVKNGCYTIISENYKCTYKNGKYHSFHGRPAEVQLDGKAKSWYRDGIPYRANDKPYYEFDNGYIQTYYWRRETEAYTKPVEVTIDSGLFCVPVKLIWRFDRHQYICSPKKKKSEVLNIDYLGQLQLKVPKNKGLGAKVAVVDKSGKVFGYAKLC